MSVCFIVLEVQPRTLIRLRGNPTTATLSPYIFLFACLFVYFCKICCFDQTEGLEFVILLGSWDHWSAPQSQLLLRFKCYFKKIPKLKWPPTSKLIIWYIKKSRIKAGHQGTRGLQQTITRSQWICVSVLSPVYHLSSFSQLLLVSWKKKILQDPVLILLFHTLSEWPSVGHLILPG